MRSPTLIPDTGTYGCALLVLLCLAAPSLAARLHTRWAQPRGMSFGVVYAASLCGIVVWGALVFDPARLLGNAPAAWLIGLPSGVVAGSIARSMDRRIVRWLWRRQVGRSRWSGLGASQGRDVVPVTLDRSRAGWQSSAPGPDLGVASLGAIAMLEELTYRGWLVQACLLLPGQPAIALGLVGSVLAFAVSHSHFGWQHALAKLPLAGLALALALALGTVVPAIVAHVTFNTLLSRERRLQPVVVRVPTRPLAAIQPYGGQR